MNLANITLKEMSDSDIETLADSMGKGKPPVYKQPIRQLLEVAGDKQGSLTIPWKEINPNADKRQTVLMGMRTAIKKHDAAKDRMTVLAATDDAKVTVVIKKAK
jgi:hypothetical protein